MRENESESAHADEFAEVVACHAAVGEDFQADVGEDYQDPNRAEKAENLSRVGENEVVVHFGNRDIFRGLGKEPLAEDLSRKNG